MNDTGGILESKELTLSEHRKEFIFETLEQRPVAYAPAIVMQNNRKMVSMGKDQPSLMRRINNKAPAS